MSASSPAISVVLSGRELYPLVAPALPHLERLQIHCRCHLASLWIDPEGFRRWIIAEEQSESCLLLVVEHPPWGLAMFAAATVTMPVLALTSGDTDIRLLPMNVAAVSADAPESAARLIASMLAQKNVVHPIVSTPTLPESRPRVHSAPQDDLTEIDIIESTARAIALAYGNPVLGPEHCLAAILDTPDCVAHSVLLTASGDLKPLAGHLVPKLAPESPSQAGPAILGEATREMLQVAQTLCRGKQRTVITSLDLLKAIAFHVNSPAADSLWESGLTAYRLTQVIQEHE